MVPLVAKVVLYFLGAVSIRVPTFKTVLFAFGVVEVNVFSPLPSIIKNSAVSTCNSANLTLDIILLSKQNFPHHLRGIE